MESNLKVNMIREITEDRPGVAVRGKVFAGGSVYTLFNELKKFLYESELDPNAIYWSDDKGIYFSGERPMSPDEEESYRSGLFE